MINTILLVAGLAATALSAPLPQQLRPRAEVRPKVKSTNYVANVTDPSLSRDSCGSSRVGGRALWTCRDTTLYDVAKDECTLPVVTNTASWTNMDMTKGGPYFEKGTVGAGSSGSNNILKMYGNNAYSLETYFPVLEDECPSNGQCQDNSRWAIWPDQPPVITESTMDGGATGYTWVRKSHLRELTNLNTEPAHTLYKTTYTPNADPNALPTVSIVSPDFWKQGEIGYGQYGSVIHDSTLYLYGQTDAGKGTVLAKVPTTSVEDRSTYQFYDAGTWSNTPPSINSTTAPLPNAGAGGQGTFYYSAAFQSYIWIGQQAISASADFYMSTAPAPEGPWIEPYLIFQGRNGDNAIGGYSLQAHPALLASEDKSERGIWVSWTQQFEKGTMGAVYNTPLVWVEFE
ncbi:hypothetical protein PRZ48_011424 [Zasmidium cellare]|uniref:DUF4185 domain-containing protein n=1 Tax=Zasmidium cellare TaxID=395010 RepID=A0ABR0E6V6_ZASCE|nr:hypothetical protein PRZ48_011424 [Zasmidium cellare]